MDTHLPLLTEIDGARVSRAEVLAWERVRARKVARLLRAEELDGVDDVDLLREGLLEAKRRIGPAEIQRRLAGRTRVGDAVSSVAARLVNGRRAVSSVRIHSPSGTAEEFARWFTVESEAPDSDAMLLACPDHFFIGDDGHGRQKVVETTGGSPLPTQFLVDYSDLSTLTTMADSAFPIQIAGVATTAGGLPIGGVRHQFRNLPGGGFESWNTVEFPTIVGQRIIRGHRWHLACEFGNWIELQQG